MISPELVMEIARHVETEGLDHSTAARLRQAYPGMHFATCQDDDINNLAPVLNNKTFNVYLLDARSHCLSLTRDYEAATGVVLAELPDDSEY
ncbi:MAG: DUF6129 family protein [Candidatus Competibacteraceae bacterium]